MQIPMLDNAPAVRASAGRPLGRTLFAYLVREIVWPTLLATIGLLLLSIMGELVAYSDLVINRGFGLREVSEIALYRSVPMLGRALPFSMFLGALIALGRMAADGELLVLEASGVSPRWIVAPILLIAAILTALGIGITGYAEPWANGRLAEEIEASVLRSSGTILRSGVVTAIGDWRIVAREASSRGDRLRGVAIWVPSLGDTVFAENAELIAAEDGSRSIAIENGVILHNSKSGPSYTRFGHMQDALTGSDDIDVHRALNRLSTGSLSDLAQALQQEMDPADRRELLAEWHRRVALPAAALPLALLVVPLAMWPRRTSRAAGVVAGLGAMVVYVVLLQLSSNLTHARAFSVRVAVWLPDVMLLGAGVALPWLLSGRGPGRRRPPPPSRAKATPVRRARRDRLILDRYVLLRFLELAGICFAALLAIFVLIDVVDNLQWFTKYHSTLDEVLRFYAARIPLLVARVVPMALFVAAALTVSLFGATGELVGMQASGVSTLRIVLPILLASVVVAVGYQAMTDQVVPQSIARATQIKRFEIKGQVERVSVWSWSRDHLYQADRIDPLAGIAHGLTVYALDADGLPVSRTDASEARYVGGGTWHLYDPKQIIVEPDGLRVGPAEPFVRLGDEFAAEPDGTQLSIAELHAEIRALEARGYDATGLRVDLQAKLAAPLACILLPAIALVFATGGPPLPRPARVLLMSAALGLGYVGLSALGVALGYRGAASPLVAGWAPTAIFVLAGLVVAAARLPRLRRA
jgi:lipopolysaccharide export system permease protein